MAAEGSTAMILFIGAVIVAGIAAGAMTAVVSAMSQELRDRGEGLAKALGTDLAIVNDPDTVPYSAGTLTLYLKNTGTVTLETEELSVLIDGAYSSFTATLLDGATEWSPGSVASLAVSVTLGSGDHEAHVTHTPSISDDLDFRI